MAVYKIPLLERAKERRQLIKCEKCQHLHYEHKPGSHCYMFKDVQVGCRVFVPARIKEGGDD